MPGWVTPNTLELTPIAFCHCTGITSCSWEALAPVLGIKLSKSMRIFGILMRENGASVVRNADKRLWHSLVAHCHRTDSWTQRLEDSSSVFILLPRQTWATIISSCKTCIMWYWLQTTCLALLPLKEKILLLSYFFSKQFSKHYFLKFTLRLTNRGDSH